MDQATADVFGGSIRPAPEKKNGKDITISFAKAVALENKRGSVTKAQKAGRAKKAKALVAKAPVAKAKKGTKRKRTATDEVIDAPTGESVLTNEPVQRAKRQCRAPVAKPTKALRQRR